MSNDNTELAVRTLLSTLSPAARARVIADNKPAAPEQIDRIIRRAEAAKLLACTTRTIDNMALAGHLKRVSFPGRKNGAGFRLSDITALISGAGKEAA